MSAVWHFCQRQFRRLKQVPLRALFGRCAPAEPVAAERGHTDVVRLALDAGVDVEFRDADHFKKTPLHNAVYFGREECARLLIARGADVNAVFSWTRVVDADEAGISSLAQEVSVLHSDGTGKFSFRRDDSVLDCALNRSKDSAPLSRDFIDLLLARGAKTAKAMGGFRGIVGLTAKARSDIAAAGMPAP